MISIIYSFLLFLSDVILSSSLLSGQKSSYFNTLRKACEEKRTDLQAFNPMISSENIHYMYIFQKADTLLDFYMHFYSYCVIMKKKITQKKLKRE